MTIEQFKQLTSGCTMGYEIKMSNMTKEGTIKYPESAMPGYLENTCDGFIFEIDNTNHCLLSDFYSLIQKEKLSDDIELIAWDLDDGNVINFTDVYIFNNLIILIP